VHWFAPILGGSGASDCVPAHIHTYFLTKVESVAFSLLLGEYGYESTCDIGIDFRHRVDRRGGHRSGVHAFAGGIESLRIAAKASSPSKSLDREVK